MAGVHSGLEPLGLSQSVHRARTHTHVVATQRCSRHGEIKSAIVSAQFELLLMNQASTNSIDLSQPWARWDL